MDQVRLKLPCPSENINSKSVFHFSSLIWLLFLRFLKKKNFLNICIKIISQFWLKYKVKHFLAKNYYCGNQLWWRLLDLSTCIVVLAVSTMYCNVESLLAQLLTNFAFSEPVGVHSFRQIKSKITLKNNEVGV